MSPSIITIDNTPDFDFDVNPAPTKNGNFTNFANSQRTLLLAPPSVAAQGTAALPNFDRATTDLQMLDRLSAGLVTLPAATYDLILLLTDADGARHAEATGLLSREVFASLVPAMKPSALLKTQDNTFGAAETREAVLAGLVEKNGNFEKVEEEEVVIPLRFGKKKNGNTVQGNGAGQNGNGTVHGSAGTIDVAGEPNTLDMVSPAVKPVAGVGFDFGDDLDDYSDEDDLIDEDDLMTEEDLNRPIQMRTFSNHYTANISVYMLTPQSLQLPSASLSRARSAAPARTAPAVSPSASRLKTRPAAPRLTRP